MFPKSNEEVTTLNDFYCYIKLSFSIIFDEKKGFIISNDDQSSYSLIQYSSMTQLLSHTFAHPTGSSFRLKAKLLPIKNILGVKYN